MKFINKGAEPQDFLAWKAQGNGDWQPLWNSISSPVKKLLKEALLEEQGFICCYCEGRIDRDSSHIEHFKPRHSYRAEELSYQNLLCSCEKNLSKKDAKTCGHAKSNWYDKKLLISPLSINCESRFRFSSSGEIKASNKSDNASKETIRRLNLNLYNLIESRKNIIDVYIADASNDLDAILKMKDGKYEEFHTTIKQVLSL